MSKGFVYILECSDGSYYTSSTIDLLLRIEQHQNGLGGNHTKKRLPIKLVYYEEFTSIDEAFQREKQIQGWSRKKKEALINKHYKELPNLSQCKNESHHSNVVSTPLNHSESVPVAERSRSYHSHGKLLLTGEYVVLDGAISLAVPTKQGQSLQIETIETPIIYWKSLDENGAIWYENEFEIDNGMLKQHFDKLNVTVQHGNISSRLFQIFEALEQLQPGFLSITHGFKITTTLEFPRNWGLGTSSTLINNIAQWANVDAFKLLELTFGGSGYDIACAQNNTPITYQLKSSNPVIEKVAFNPSFKAHLYFVHLNKKQNSREGIAHYRNQSKKHIREVISEVNEITSKMISCDILEAFEVLINRHEAIIASVTNQIPVKELLFNDYNGCIKSLGAWGGDFVLATSKDNPTEYFKNKGYETIIPYSEMVL